MTGSKHLQNARSHGVFMVWIGQNLTKVVQERTSSKAATGSWEPKAHCCMQGVMSRLSGRIRYYNSAETVNISYYRKVYTVCTQKGAYGAYGWSSVCTSLNGTRDGTRIDHEKKASQQRQFDALASVLLGNLGSLHSHRCYMYHLPTHCCKYIT